MFSRISLVFFFVATLVVMGCDQTPTDGPSRRWDNIHRLFMNEPHAYTFMIKDDPKGKEFHMIKVINHELHSTDRISPIIIEDVSEDEMMWATAKVRYCGEGSYYHGLEIHIHKVRDVEPGGWERRVNKRFQEGQNAVIE